MDSAQLQYWLSNQRCAVCDFWRADSTNKFISLRRSWHFFVSGRQERESRNQHLTFWREQKTYEKILQGKLRWLTFTNRFDNHKSIWALSYKYHSDAKWFGKHNGIIHFRLNLIAAKAFISRRWRTILESQSVLFFFYPAKMSSAGFYFNSLSCQKSGRFFVNHKSQLIPRAREARRKVFFPAPTPTHALNYYVTSVLIAPFSLFGGGTLKTSFSKY